ASEPARAAEQPVTAERLLAAPPELLGLFARAVTIGDVTAALEAAEGVRAHDAALADELRRMVRAYRFDELIELLAACDAR
ncbi:hypothetical protein OVW20_29415, partial [Klebsiella pneumoniae]|uniref:hypothetical protein n=1 Tax=Klebsiella pneumoniae TaxID=573 RepID=UPI0022712088